MAVHLQNHFTFKKDSRANENMAIHIYSRSGRARVAVGSSPWSAWDRLKFFLLRSSNSDSHSTVNRERERERERERKREREKEREGEREGEREREREREKEVLKEIV